MREYGIGRVPRDVNPVDETLARLEAERLESQIVTPASHRGQPVRCRRCGERGWWGESPFTTYGHEAPGTTGICDDCGA